MSCGRQGRRPEAFMLETLARSKGGVRAFSLGWLRAFSRAGRLIPEYRRAGATGEPGFEPGLTDPESVVLPLHHSPGTGFKTPKGGL